MAAEITTVCARAVQAGRDEVKQQAALAGKTHLLNNLEATRYNCFVSALATQPQQASY